MPQPGRVPDLDEPRRARVEMRLSDRERVAVDRAAADAGLSVGEWLRVTALTAAGASDLITQLRRVEPSLADRLAALQRRRTMEIPQGAMAPFWTHGPTAHCSMEECVSERLAFPSALVLHAQATSIPWGPDEVWPPAHGRPRVRGSELPERVPRAFHEELMARRAAIAPNLMDPKMGLHTRTAWAVEDGCSIDAVVVTNAMDDRGPTKPHGYAVFRRIGLVEAVFELRANGTELALDSFPDLPALLERHLDLLVGVGAEWPIVVGISLVGVKGWQLRGPSLEDANRYVWGTPLPRGEISLPIVELAERPADLRVALRRPLDALWHEGGLRECHLLRGDGAGVGTRRLDPAS